MNLISKIALEAQKTGYLTVRAENQLRQLLAKKYDHEDFRAFMKLQQAALEGRVQQESRELSKTWV